jgi:hypothetical protein
VRARSRLAQRQHKRAQRVVHRLGVQLSAVVCCGWWREHEGSRHAQVGSAAGGRAFNEAVAPTNQPQALHPCQAPLTDPKLTSASCRRMGRTRGASGRVREVSSWGIHMNQIQGGRERSSTALPSSSPTTPALGVLGGDGTSALCRRASVDASS